MEHALATAQHVWDCRYSQLTYRLSPENEPDHRQTLWVCFRDPGPRRPVTEEECATCARWELDLNNVVNP
jgi:hypothetical protein